MGNNFGRNIKSPSTVQPYGISSNNGSSVSVDINVPVDVTTKGKSKSMSFFTKTRSFFEASKSQPSTVIANKSEIENLQSDVDVLKQDYEVKLEKLQIELDKSNEELQQLHGEIKFLYISHGKMKAQVEKSKTTEADALERGNLFETERDEIKRRFKTYKEATEKKVFHLIQEKERLLSYLRQSISEDMIKNILDGSIESEERRPGPESEPGSVQSFDNKYSLETAFLLKKLLTKLLDFQDGVPLLNVYSIVLISSSSMFDTADKLIKSCRKAMLQLEMDGRLSSIKYFPLLVENDANANKRKELMRQCVNECNVLLVLLSENDVLSNRAELFELINICSKNTVVGSIGFLSLQENEQLQQVQIPEKITVYENDKDEDEIVKSCVSKLSELLQYFWKKQIEVENLVKDPLKTDPLNDDLYIHSFDNLGSEEQKQILALSVLQHSLPMPYNKELSDLQDYIAREGPLQPYLYSSESGSGKSFILSQLASYLKETLKETCVLHHFVSCGSENSKDAVLMFKRFASLLKDQISNTQDIHQIDKSFPSWLEKICNRYTKGVVMIIDNANLLNNHEEYLKFLLDPLPVTLKVVISVCNGTPYPQEWKKWPQVVTYQIDFDQAVSYLNTSLEKIIPISKLDLMIDLINTNRDQNIVRSNICNHLTRTLVSTYLQYFSNSSNELEDFKHFLHQRDAVKMYIVLIVQLQHMFDGELVSELLTLIFISRNGLSFMDLYDLTSESTSANIYAILDMCEKFQITWQLCGLYQLRRIQVKEAMRKMFNLRSDTPLSRSLRERIIQLSMKKLRARFSSYRVADELPWQLMHINNKDALKESIENFAIFIQLHMHKKIHVLLEYWKFLQFDVNMIYETYMELLSKMEMESSFDKTIPMLYDLLGEMFQDLGHSYFHLANACYEKSLELKEANYDSDDNRVAQSFFRRGKLYLQWENIPTAERFLCHAVKIKQQNSDTCNYEYFQLMEHLAMACMCQKKSAEAEQWKREGISLRQKIMKESSERNFENAVSECASIIEDLHEREILQAKLPSFMMEIAFIYCHLQQYDEAVVMLECAIELLSKSEGNDIASIGDAKCRLSYVYQLKKSEDVQAEILLQEALVIYLENYEENSERIENAANAYVKLLRRQNRFEDIEKLYRQLIRNLEETGGEESHVLAQSLNDLAVFLCIMKRFSDSFPLFHKAVLIYSNKYGFEHDLVTDVLNNFAKVHYEMHNLQKAAMFYKMATDNKRTWSDYIEISGSLLNPTANPSPVFSSYPPSTIVSALSDH